MNTMSRRDIFQSAGLLVASPLLLSSMSATGFAQSATIAERPRRRFSKDIHNYVTDTMSLTTSKLEKGTFTADDLRLAASAQRLYSRHIRSLGVLPVLNAALKLSTPAPLSTVPQTVYTNSLAVLQRHNPDYTAERLMEILNGTPAPTDKQFAEVSNHGFTHCFDQSAIMFSGLATIKAGRVQNLTVGGAFSQSSSVFGNSVNYTHRPSTPRNGRAHVEHVDFNGTCKKICADIDKVLAAIASLSTAAAKTGFLGTLQKAGALAQQALDIEIQGAAGYGSLAAAETAYAEAFAAAGEGVQMLATVIEAVCEVAALGPEAIVASLGAAAAALTVGKAACTLKAIFS